MVDYKYLSFAEKLKHDYLVTMPTRKCMVCGALENPNVDIIQDSGWLCEDCRKKIRELIGVKTDG